MKRKLVRAAALVALLALAVLYAAPTVIAAEPRWTPSAAYRSSTYYENLKEIPLVGDGAFDTLSVALSQIGYHEGSSAAGYGGTSTGRGNYTEYNLAFGRVGGTYAYAWCASFVSWCLVQAGARDAAGGLFASCTLWVERLTEIGQYRTRSSGYQPRAGDLIFFRSSGTARASDHVGLVRYVKNGRVYTVEGNASDQVLLRDYALGDTYIVGYGLPDYEGTPIGVDRVAVEDLRPGVYAVTYDFLNVRADASQSAAKRGTLSRGEVVRVLSVKKGWGEIEYDGARAYVSLEYADFVAPYRVTVRYTDGTRVLMESTYRSTDTLRVATLRPTREGYAFLHWRSGELTLSSGEALAARDVTLEAVFEPLPPPIIEDTPTDGAENEEILPDGPQEELPLPEEEQVPPVLPPPIETSPDTRALRAERHAGVVSALVAILAVLAYRGKRKA